MKITKFGTDPEFFLKEGDKFKSSIPIVGMGTKEKPMPMDKDGFAFLHDNVAVEFNVPPASDLQEFTNNIRYGLKYLKNIIPDSYDIGTEASAHFPYEELVDVKATEFGCEPSFDAWRKGEQMERPSPDGTLRSCGGHIHLEFDSIDGRNMLAVVKALDLHLAVPSILMDTDLYRRDLYGKAGDYREKLKQNRFEYRVLSNFWIFDDTLIKWVWDNTLRAVEFVKEHGEIENGSNLAEIIISTINNSDYSAAASLIKKYNLESLPVPVATVYK